jgi:hypothetical protein
MGLRPSLLEVPTGTGITTGATITTVTITGAAGKEETLSSV